MLVGMWEGRLSELFCVVLCTEAVHIHKHDDHSVNNSVHLDVIVQLRYNSSRMHVSVQLLSCRTNKPVDWLIDWLIDVIDWLINTAAL